MLKQILSQIANQTYIIKDNQKRLYEVVCAHQPLHIQYMEWGNKHSSLAADSANVVSFSCIAAYPCQRFAQCHHLWSIPASHCGLQRREFAQKGLVEIGYVDAMQWWQFCTTVMSLWSPCPAVCYANVACWAAWKSAMI